MVNPRWQAGYPGTVRWLVAVPGDGRPDLPTYGAETPLRAARVRLRRIVLNNGGNGDFTFQFEKTSICNHQSEIGNRLTAPARPSPRRLNLSRHSSAR